MHIHDAIATRRSVRAFRPDPIPATTIRDVLQRAARAPSGGNLQPWQVDVLAGEPLAALKVRMQALLEEGHQETPAYEVYPPSLPSPWRERRFQVGEDMYARLGIPREDKASRRRWFARNYAFFDAPMALFCSVERLMGPPQWADLGMYFQTVMLLLRAEGLDSCAQECWAMYPATIGDALALPPGRMIFAGMSVGLADETHPVNALVSARAPLEETVRFHGV